MEIILFLDKQKAEQLDRRFNMGFRAFLKKNMPFLSHIHSGIPVPFLQEMAELALI